MTLTLHEHILENPYRMLNLRGDEDHVGVRRAADAALRRLRVGLPLVADDGWPPIPAAAATEARVRDALARLLVPATRLEARMFWSAPSRGGPFVLREDLLLYVCHYAVLWGRDWTTAADQWLDPFVRQGFVDMLLDDPVVPRVAHAQVDDLRERWPALLAGSAVASFRRFINEGNVRDARRAYDFLVQVEIEGDIRGWRWGAETRQAAEYALYHTAEAALDAMLAAGPADEDAVARFARLWPLVRYARVRLRSDVRAIRQLLVTSSAGVDFPPGLREAAATLAAGTKYEGYVRRLG